MGFDPAGQDPVAQRDERQNEQEQAAGLIVEEPADEEQIHIAQVQFLPAVGYTRTAHDQRKQRINQRKECPEIELREQ